MAVAEWEWNGLMMVSGYDRCDRYKKSDPYAYQFLYNHHNRYRIRKKNPERTWIKTDAYWYIFICNDRYCLCEMVFIKSERSLRSLEWNWGLTQRSLSQQLVDRWGVVPIWSSTITKPFQAIIWKATSTLRHQQHVKYSVLTVFIHYPWLWKGQ